MSKTLRQRILTSYLHNEELYEVIGHTWVYYGGLIFKHTALVAVVATISIIVSGIIPDQSQTLQIMQYVLGVAVLVIYGSGLLSILDAYLDGLLITNMGLILFQRDGLFRQKAINLQRVSIETIVFEQNSLWDTIFHKGTLSIFVEDQKYVFEDVHNPRAAVAMITHWKEKIIGRVHYSENEVESEEAMSKYEVLVEALGEVVTEYVQKKQGSGL